tara:strand:- start:1002 stop:2846 length:1845 start_codon:yes stop_codon:yes gene_type:complete
MILFDVEADDLLEGATKIHCLSYTSDGKDYHTIFDYQEMRDLILSQKGLIGHNITRYDAPLLEKILGIKVTARLFDTLPMSWVLNYNRSKHGLETFGVDFDIPKPEIDDWKTLAPEAYAHRCVEDVKINWLLWTNLLKRFLYVYENDKKLLDKFFKYLEFKMGCAAAAEMTGWRLDVDLAKRCFDDITKQKEESALELASVMPKRRVTSIKRKPKVCFKQDGTVSSHGEKWFKLLDEHGLPRHYDGEVTVTKGWDEPNPDSSDQVKNWLYSLGWVPCTFDYKKKDGEEKKVPQVRKAGLLTKSVEILVEQNPVVSVLEGYTILNHRLAIFKGLISSEVDGHVKAEINGLTNTMRFKHSKPLVNLPGVDKPWGEEVRGCLIAPEGYTLCGADMTSLEDTTKRHYMQPYDPAYVLEMSQDGFDPHLDLAKHAGRVTQKEIDDYNLGKRPDIQSMRKNFKVVNYSATYGVGSPKLSRETGMSISEAQALLDAYWERNWSVKSFAEDQKVRKINGEMWVKNPVSGFWYSLRYEKDIFSTLNQSTGAYCFDRWVANYRLKRPNIIGQFHDESINVVKKGEEDEHTKILKWAIEKLNQDLKLNVDLGIDVQYGQKYSDVH